MNTHRSSREPSPAGGVKPVGSAEPSGAAPTIEYRTVDKSIWGEGPWQSEPDKRQWTDAETGLPCLMVRGPVGALCGYVGVAPGHPAYGLNYDRYRYGEDGEAVPVTPIKDAINGLQAHGGLTFAGGCGHGDNPAEGICHIPGEGQPDHVWWFGFDCAHAGDYSPAIDHSRRGYGELGSATGWGTVIAYRDQAYVEAEVRALAGQLVAIQKALAAEAASPESGSTGVWPNQSPTPLSKTEVQS